MWSSYTLYDTQPGHSDYKPTSHQKLSHFSFLFPSLSRLGKNQKDHQHVTFLQELLHHLLCSPIITNIVSTVRNIQPQTLHIPLLMIVVKSRLVIAWGNMQMAAQFTPSFTYYYLKYNLETMCNSHSTSNMAQSRNLLHSITYPIPVRVYKVTCCSTTLLQLTITHTYRAKVEEKQRFGN